jgi:hypothetical protein
MIRSLLFREIVASVPDEHWRPADSHLIEQYAQVSKGGRELLLTFVLEALKRSGCEIIRTSGPEQAPFRIAFETPEGERMGVICYASSRTRSSLKTVLGIALSATAHWLFDRHLISVTDDYRPLVLPQPRTCTFAHSLCLPNGANSSTSRCSAMAFTGICLATQSMFREREALKLTYGIAGVFIAEIPRSFVDE